MSYLTMRLALLLVVLMIVLANQSAPLLCRGIQHTKLLLFTADKINHSFCSTKWSYIQGEWHSRDCRFIVDSAGSKSKSRCSKCTVSHSNIKCSHTPALYPNRSQQCNASSSSILPDAYRLMFSDKAAQRQRIIDLAPRIDSDDDELDFIANALKLKGTNTFTLYDNCVLTVCVSDG